MHRTLEIAVARPARHFLLVVVASLVAALVPAQPGQARVGSDVVLSASETKPFVGQRTALTAVVQPKVSGRKVRFEVKNGSGWVSKGTSTTDRRGRASLGVKFSEAGRQRVRAVALKHRRADKATDTMVLKVRKRPTTISGTWPAGPWQVDDAVLVTAALEPANAGRSVWLERSTGGSWQTVSDPVPTDSRGEARISWTPAAAGTHDYRLAVGGTSKLAPAESAPVSRTVEGAGPLVVAAPEWVLEGELFEVALEITAAADAALEDVVVTVEAPEAGSQSTPPSEVEVDPVDRTGQVDVGDVAAGRTERLRLRWQAPPDPVSLTFAAAMTAEAATGAQQHDDSADVEVLAPPAGGGAFGGGLELTRDSRRAPDHPDQVVAFCDVPVTDDVPTFDEAKTSAEAYLAGAILDEEAWNEEEALQDAELIDQVVMVALADRRPAAALAAALRGHDLAPNDAVHLTNAAVAANQLGEPGWAVAFTRQAALSGPAPSVGAPQEAIRLATQAHAWALMRDWSRAEVAIRDALMVDPDNPQLHMQLGIFRACQGDKAGALPHVRRGLRSSEAPDPMESPDDYEEDMKQTWLGASDLYDLSGGTEDTITTPSLPSDWAQLVARGPIEGNNYYDDEYERLHQRVLELAEKRNELRGELNARMAGASPAWRKRTDDILGRISREGDRAVREAWESYLEYQNDAISLNNCEDGQFTSHPFCNPENPTDFGCSNDQAVFEEWLNRMRGWETAMNDYQDVAWPIFTGLQANLADPTAHELAGVDIELHFLNSGMTALAQNLAWTSRYFTFYDSDQENNEPESCLTPTTAGETAESEVSGGTPAFCSPDSVETKFSVTIDLGIMSFGFDCEKVSVETGLGAYGFLEAFARVEQRWNTSAVTYYVGVQAGVPGVGDYESALFLETDAAGKVQDLGLESGVSSSAGYVVEVELYSKSSRVSAMSYFTSFN